MSATDELRRMLDERGVEYVPNMFGITWGYYSDAHTAAESMEGTLIVTGLTPEQAIAATLGNELPYDELLRCLKNDWHINVSWDGLRKFWCIELTEEGVRMRDAAHSTLTAEQVREAIEENSWKEAFMLLEFNESSWQAIADELNAAMGAETCRNIDDDYDSYFECSKCGCHVLCDFYGSGYGKPRFCPGCGRKVER